MAQHFNTGLDWVASESADRPTFMELKKAAKSAAYNINMSYFHNLCKLSWNTTTTTTTATTTTNNNKPYKNSTSPCEIIHH